MNYIITLPLPVGVGVTEHTNVVARSALAVALGRPVKAVEYRGSMVSDLDPSVEYYIFREVNE